MNRNKNNRKMNWILDLQGGLIVIWSPKGVGVWEVLTFDFFTTAVFDRLKPNWRFLPNSKQNSNLINLLKVYPFQQSQLWYSQSNNLEIDNSKWWVIKFWTQHNQKFPREWFEIYIYIWNRSLCNIFLINFLATCMLELSLVFTTCSLSAGL